MMYRVLGLSLCFAMIVAVCGQSDAAFLYGEIEADGNDGFTEQRDANPPVVHPSYDGSGGEGWFMNVGEWFGPGITTAVIPFQLPDFGPVNNPFASASLGLRVFEKGNATVTDLDLYGVRVDSNPAILDSDHYQGSTPDPSATLIQASFLTPSSTTDGSNPGPNNFSSVAGEAALASYLNTAYAGGANAGNYAFLRLSYSKDGFAAGWDAYKFTSANAGAPGDAPVISFAAIPEPSSIVMLVAGALFAASTRRQG